jgi:hypothetical protein
VRAVLEEVADRAQSQLGQLLRDRRSDAGQRFDASFEPLRLRKTARTRPRGRRLGLGERGRERSRQGAVEYRTGGR